MLVFQDTTGGFQYKEEIKLSDPIIRKTFYSLSITPDFRITKLNKYGVQGEFRIQGLEEFDELTLTHGYSYYSTLTTKRNKKTKNS
ncbi:MAG: hypothetical protein KatS3mg002_1388 [Candidatus Woesearchaeota archaeon]|nr:MAG: hypothetical protein KatS3mg002_1388 [Candidatus Woesearchaeota archaeon]